MLRIIGLGFGELAGEGVGNVKAMEVMSRNLLR